MDQNLNGQIDDQKNLKRKKWLIGIVLILSSIIIVLLILITLKATGKKFSWTKIIPWLKEFSDENKNLNNLPNNNAGNLENDIIIIPLPEGSGPSDYQTINLNNNISVTLPTSYAIYSGWKENLNLTFKNNSNQPQTVNLKFSSLAYTYINDLTPSYNNQSQQINLTAINLNPGETQEYQLPIQTAKVWDNYFTLYLNEKEQKINLNVTIRDKTPLFGNDNSACASNQPFLPTFGPNCGPCANNGFTTDRDCIITAKRSGLNSCYPYKFEYYPEKEDDIINQCNEALKFNSQITRNAPIGWGIMIDENNYAWEKADWYIDAVSNKVKAQQGLPSWIMGGDGGWAVTCSECTNPDGSKGLFDLDNTFLMNKLRQFVYDLTKRYKEKIKYYEMANEPAAEFYLCVCALTTVPEYEYLPPNTPQCNAPSGPNQPVCAGGDHYYQQDFADAYSDLLAGTTKIASEELKKNYSQGWIVTGSIDDQNKGLTPITRMMIEQGILDNGNVAIGIHQYPHHGLAMVWSATPVDCTYFKKPDNAYWLPEECEKAPAFSGYSNPSKNKNYTMGQIWQEMDERYDASEIIQDIQELGYLDKTYFFDSESHAGFANPQPKYDLTEAIAGFRVGTINAHQKFLGTIYFLANTNNFSAKVFNQMTKILTGVSPYYKWESKLVDSNYSSVVYKLFTRGNEDILVFWSNNDQVKNVNLNTNNNVSNLSDFEIIGFDANQGTNNFININKPNSLPTQFSLNPVKEIKVISVMRQEGSQPFEWLDGINY